MKWKQNVHQIPPKLTAGCFVIRKLFPVLNLVTLWMVYFADFHSVIKYGIILGGISINTCKVFKLQKRIIRIMSWVVARRSCRGSFETGHFAFAISVYIVSNVICNR